MLRPRASRRSRNLPRQESSKPTAPAGEGDVKGDAPKVDPAVEAKADPAAAKTDPAAAKTRLAETMTFFRPWQLQQLTQQLNQAPAGTEEQGPDPLVQLDEQLAALQQQATAGEITYEEMIVQTAPIIEQRATLNIQRQMEQQAQQRQVQDAQGQFLQQYPDFQQFAQSPEANALIQQNPVFDHVSAYFATREQKQAAENQQLQAQIAELQKQIQTSIKKCGKHAGAPLSVASPETSAFRNSIAAMALTSRKAALPRCAVLDQQQIKF